MENIRRNNEVCRSLGVKRITPSSIGLVQHKCLTAKAKRTKCSNSELDDVDYRHQDNEDDHDDSDSRDSFEQEIIKMPHGGRSAHSYPDPQCGDNVMSERVTRSTPRSNMDSQSLPTPITKPLSEELPNNNVASINRRTRGPTRGIEAQRVIDKKGTLPIVIAPQFHAPVGEHAARMASKIGMEVRTHLMDLGVHRWKAVDDTVKAPILQRLTDKFDLQGNPSHVGKIVARQCGRTLSSFSYLLALAVVYKSTHFNPDTNEWITPESEIIHDKIEHLEAEQNSQDGAIPMTQEELSIKVFGPRSGYVTGLGMRPSSSSRSIVGLGDNITYVKQLEQKVQEQADQIQEQAEGIEAANNKIHELVEAKEEQGRTLARVMEHLKCQGLYGQKVCTGDDDEMLLLFVFGDA
ncbi:hypothetical protein Acr_00g0041600 [Actinidia rufa]|uniref:Uncharacterized protein n=1 Tax=Actinidia rufa TaxID=165716 RepID=A0A7J0DI58_9ERIC|nr:hypothetical protein Acr_00g0041600 [Actinidia rufa]